MMTTEKTDLRAEAAALAIREIAIETNGGTFGAEEACRCTGNGGGGKYTVYERVGDGARRTVGATGCGRARRINIVEMADARERLAELRREIRPRR